MASYRTSSPAAPSIHLAPDTSDTLSTRIPLDHYALILRYWNIYHHALLVASCTWRNPERKNVLIHHWRISLFYPFSPVPVGLYNTDHLGPIHQPPHLSVPLCTHSRISSLFTAMNFPLPVWCMHYPSEFYIQFLIISWRFLSTSPGMLPWIHPLLHTLLH